MDNNRSQRREFLRKLIAGTAVGLAAPSVVLAHNPEPVGPPADSADEKYWEMIKRQFAIPSNLTMMNAANLCPSPYPVMQVVQQTYSDLSKDVSFQFRDKFDVIRQTSLRKLATYLGVGQEEVCITRNTSEGNNIIVNGFDLKAGDEVLLWDENHESNLLSWEHRAKRQGFVVKKVTLPSSPASADEILQVFQRAMTPKTRLLAFSHISNHNAIVIPAKELCVLARSRNILTHVDGAQSFGFMDLDLKAMGCDSYTGSLHKWLMGPFENGILYVRKEVLACLWPQIISAGWAEANRNADPWLGILGQRNEATPAAIPEAIDFHLAIGKKNVEERVRQLNRQLRSKLQAAIPGVKFISPEPLTANITMFNVPNKTSKQLYDELYARYGVASAPMAGLRLSPNIYNTLADIDKVVDAVARVSG
jgi:selenocysteine lyase/cysteine desulfurase